MTRNERVRERDDARRDLSISLDIDVSDGPSLTERQREAQKTWVETAQHARVSV